MRGGIAPTKSCLLFPFVCPEPPRRLPWGSTAGSPREISTAALSSSPCPSSSLGWQTRHSRASWVPTGTGPGGAQHPGGSSEGWGPVPSGLWAQQEPVFLSQTFYAVSFLMVVVYAYEAYRAIHGWRAWHVAALQVSVPQMWHSRAAPSPCTAAPAPQWPGKQRGQPHSLGHRWHPLHPARSQQSRAGASSCCGTGRAGSRRFPPCRRGVGAWRARGGVCPTSWPGRCQPPAPSLRHCPALGAQHAFTSASPCQGCCRR